MRKGFTLIELLVVIAIIAILAAILFPVFAKARDAARTSKCLAHGRQVGQATLMYMDDYSGKFPSGITQEAMNSLPTWNFTWFTQEASSGGANSPMRYYYLKKYVKNNDIWLCPNPGTNYTKRYIAKFHSNWCDRGSDRFINGDRGFVIWIDSNGDKKQQDNEWVGQTPAEVQALDADPKNPTCGARYMPPSKKIMWMCYALGEWGSSNVGDGWPYVFPSYAHGNGTNYVYVDGHAAWQRMGTGWAPIGYTKSPIDQPSRGN